MGVHRFFGIDFNKRISYCFFKAGIIDSRNSFIRNQITCWPLKRIRSSGRSNEPHWLTANFFFGTFRQQCTAKSLAINSLAFLPEYCCRHRRVLCVDIKLCRCKPGEYAELLLHNAFGRATCEEHAGAHYLGIHACHYRWKVDEYISDAEQNNDSESKQNKFYNLLHDVNTK